jgi:hypothetical protein
MGVIGDNTPVLQGGTDGTEIGNVADAMKVNIVGSSFNPLTAAANFIFMGIDIQIGNNKSMLSISNTGTAPVFIRSVRLVNSQTAAVTGIIAEFRLLKFGTHSAGTVVTGIAADSADAIPGTLTARTGATLTSLGTVPFKRSKWSTDEWGVGALDVESNDHVFHNLFPWYTPTDNTKPITLRQNEGITVQQVVNSTVGTFTITIEVSL